MSPSRGRDKEVRMRRTPIAILIILLIVLIGLGYFMTNPESAQEVLAELGLVEPVQEGYSITGMLEVQATYLAGVNAGRVLEIPVAEGQYMDEGEILAKLDTALILPQLDAAQARVDAAEAQLDMLLADTREVDLAVAEAALELALASQEGATQALEDAREYSPEQVKDEQISLAQASIEQAKADVDLAQINLTALEDGPSQYQIASAEAAVEAAEADLNSQKAKLEDQVIKAPSEGVILEVFMLPGELSLPGQPILALADIDTLEVSVYIPEAELGWANIGDEVDLTVDAYPERVFRGEVIFIADEAEFTPRNVQTPEQRVILVYEVRIRVPNAGGDLKPGLPAQVTFGVGS
jgi:HlyD family secretion protein